ncbi:hypothetical protein PGB90_010504 [Kerria lacca]
MSFLNRFKTIFFSFRRISPHFENKNEKFANIRLKNREIFCKISNNCHLTYSPWSEPVFDWSTKDQGLILSASSYGVLLSPLGGILGTKFGGTTVFGLIILLNAISTIIVPFLLRLNIIAFLIQRVFDGIVQGLVPASIMEICSHWAPPEERSRIIVCGIVGIYFGTAINYPLCGFIAKTWGWEEIFYITGGISIVWYLIWIMLVSDDPSTDKFISESEKQYLKEKIGYSIGEKIVYPWKSILTSKPVWAYINEFFVLGWSFSFIIFGLPLYVNDMLHVPIEAVGVISSLPDLATLVSLPLAALLADYLRANKIMSIQNVHRLFITFGQVTAVILLIVIGISSSFIGSIVCFSLFRFCYGFAEASYEVLPADLAPRYSGVIRGIATTGQAISLILSPTIMGFMVSNHTSFEWNSYFLFLCTLNIWGGIIYFVYGSGDVQPWAVVSSKEDTAISNSEKASTKI